MTTASQADSERLRLALAAARLGDWSWDASSDVVTFSRRAAEIFQIPPGPEMTWAEMRDLLHPHDRERARLAVEQALATNADYSIEYRLVNGSGERWVSARGRGTYDRDGTVGAMIGVVQDITDSVRTREALAVQAEATRASEERYRAFIENSSEGIVMALMYALPAPDALIGQTLDFMLPSSDPDARAYLMSSIEAGYRVSEVESRERDAQCNVIKASYGDGARVLVPRRSSKSEGEPD